MCNYNFGRVRSPKFICLEMTSLACCHLFPPALQKSAWWRQSVRARAFVWEIYRQMTITDAIYKICKECFMILFLFYYFKNIIIIRIVERSFSFLSFFFQSFSYLQIFQLKWASGILFYTAGGVAWILRFANKRFNSFKTISFSSLTRCLSDIFLEYIWLK